MSTRRLRDVQVDPASRTVRVGAGARGHDLTAALVPHGLAPLGGSSPDVGVVGYHLGGGLPLLGRTFGYAADRVRALDVVTADGQVRTLTPDDDLFRAMLGCRGAFGVVTSLVTEALPLTSVTGGGLWFTGDAIDPAVRAYLRWTADVPETVNSSVRIAHVRVAAVGDSSSSATWAARSPTAGPRSAAATPSTSSTPAARGSHALDVAFTAEDQAWLSRVKRAWDPDDLFRVAPFRVP